ncbi:MAG: CAP domain-containing protein [Flavobacteriales bacterium]
MKSLAVLFVAVSLNVFAQQSEFDKYSAYPMTPERLAVWKQDSIKYNHLINSDSIEIYLLQHFNALRKSYNLKPLSLYVNDSAYIKCNQWADYLLDNKKIGHNGDAYEIAATMVINCNQFYAHKSNINLFLANQLYNMWLNSPKHKLAILNPDKKFMISCSDTRFSYAAPFFNKNLVGLARFFE